MNVRPTDFSFLNVQKSKFKLCLRKRPKQLNLRRYVPASFINTEQIVLSPQMKMQSGISNINRFVSWQHCRIVRPAVESSDLISVKNST